MTTVDNRHLSHPGGRKNDVNTVTAQFVKMRRVFFSIFHTGFLLIS